MDATDLAFKEASIRYVKACIREPEQEEEKKKISGIFLDSAPSTGIVSMSDNETPNGATKMNGNGLVINLDNTVPETLPDALVTQKNELLYNINYAETATALYAAMRMVEFAAIVWNVTGYDYKVRELKLRVIDKADQLLTEIEVCRRGKRGKMSGLDEQNIRKLKEIKDCMR